MPDFEALQQALVSLPLAALLGGLLAFRLRRPSTPPRRPAVIQTQVMLAIIGALIMFVVGENLARAFGIVGAASLVRYRARIADPKDAAVMLATLAIGLACGAGLYGIAVFATAFILAVLLAVESFDREDFKVFELTVATRNPPHFRPLVERVLGRYHARAELRSLSSTEISYKVKLPTGTHVDRLSTAILALDRDAGTDPGTTIEWDEKKPKD